MLTKHKKTTLIGLLLFILVITLLGLPFTQWWFTGDDFGGVFLGYKTKSLRDLIYFFYEGNVGQGLANPGGEVLGRASFMGVYYRPLYCVFIALQYFAFGTNGYGYLLCNVVAHAASTALLFRLFSFITSAWAAAAGALLFALHPQIAYRFGAVVNFHYYVNVLLVLLIATLLKRYLDTGDKIAYVGSLICFALSLLTRETTLILPAIIGFSILLYRAPCRNWHLVLRLPQAVLYGLPFGLVAIAYLGLRLYLYPLDSVAAHSNFLPYALTGNFVAAKTQELLVMLYDFLWLSWLPWGNKLLKVCMLMPTAATGAYLWWQCREKFLVGCLLTGALLMLWPGFISFYSPRYFYEAAPLTLAAYLFLVHYAQASHRLKKLLLIGVWLFIMLSMPFTIYNFMRREAKLACMHTAVTLLATEPGIKDQPLCFLTTPSDGFAGGYNPHIFWILFNNRWQQLYFDHDLAVTQADSNVVQSLPWGMVASRFFDKNYVSITPQSNGFRITSHNHNKVLFNFANTGPCFGQKVIHERQGHQVSDFELIIAPTIAVQQPWYIWWDYKQKKFQIIKSLD